MTRRLLAAGLALVIAGAALLTVAEPAGAAAPVAVGDAVGTAVNTTRTIWVLGNDTDADRDTLDVVAVTDPPNGTSSLSTITDTVSYTPTTGFTGVDTFTYTVSDGASTATATVTVSVNPSAPVAVGDAVGTAVNTTRTIWVLGNDTDADRDTLDVVAVTDPPNGTSSLSTITDTVSYTPTTGFTGVDTFTYTVSDGASTATATVTVSVNPSAPVAVGDAVGTAVNTTRTIWVLGNDTDADRDTLDVVAVTDPPNGTSSLSTITDTVSYTPTTGFTGVDTFTYTVSDGASTATATVTVTVGAGGGGGAPPDAVDDTVATRVAKPIIVHVLGNDRDPDNDPLDITVGAVNPPAAGTAQETTPNRVAFSPAAGFAGLATFTYTASDGALTDTATVTVAVDANAPDAVDDTVATRVAKPIIVHVLGNDRDPDNDPLDITVGAVNPPTAGTAQETTPNRVAFSPAAGFAGLATFTYTASDGALTDTATVTVAVDANAPDAVDDTVATRVAKPIIVHVLGNDRDPDNDPLDITVGAVNPPTAGTAQETTPNRVAFSPAAGFAGLATFTYTASDGALTDTATATVAVGVPLPTTSTTSTSSTTSSSTTSSTSTSSTSSTSTSSTSSTSTTSSTTSTTLGGSATTSTTPPGTTPTTRATTSTGAATPTGTGTGRTTGGALRSSSPGARPGAGVEIRGDGFAPRTQVVLRLVAIRVDPTTTSTSVRPTTTTTTRPSTTTTAGSRVVSGVSARPAVPFQAAPPPVELGSLPVDEAGAFVGTVEIPPATPAGEYEIEAAGTAPDGTTRILDVPIAVGGPRLPRSGALITDRTALGGLLLGIGLVLLGFGQRSRAAPPTSAR